VLTPPHQEYEDKQLSRKKLLACPYANNSNALLLTSAYSSFVIKPSSNIWAKIKLLSIEIQQLATHENKTSFSKSDCKQSQDVIHLTVDDEENKYTQNKLHSELNIATQYIHIMVFHRLMQG